MEKLTKDVRKALERIDGWATRKEKAALSAVVAPASDPAYQKVAMRLRAALNLHEKNELTDQLKAEGHKTAQAMSDHILKLYCSGVHREPEEPEPEPDLRSRFDRFEGDDG